MAGSRSKRANRAAAIFTIAALAGVLCSGAPKTDGKVTNVRFWSLGDTTRIAIEVTSEFKYNSVKLANPDRVFFDIQGAKLEMAPNKAMHVIAVGDAMVRQIRIAESQPGVTRVVLDLAQSAEFTASQLSNPDRLMVEVRSKTGAAPPATTSTSGAKSVIESPVRACGSRYSFRCCNAAVDCAALGDSTAARAGLIAKSRNRNSRPELSTLRRCAPMLA